MKIILGDNMRVKTQTLEDYVKVVKYALSTGYVWQGLSKNILEHQWSRHRENTYVGFDVGGIWYGNYIEYQQRFDEDVLNIDEFYNEIGMGYIKIIKEFI